MSILDDIRDTLRDRWSRHIPVDLDHATETAQEHAARELAEARDRRERTAHGAAQVKRACRKFGVWFPPSGGKPW